MLQNSQSNDLDEFSKQLEALKQETVKNLLAVSERDKKDKVKKLTEELTKIK